MPRKKVHLFDQRTFAEMWAFQAQPSKQRYLAGCEQPKVVGPTAKKAAAHAMVNEHKNLIDQGLSCLGSQSLDIHISAKAKARCRIDRTHKPVALRCGDGPEFWS